MSLSDQLDSKQPHEATCTFPVGAGGAAAAKEYEDAQNRLELIKMLNARRKSDEPKVDLKVAEAEVRKARQRYAKTSVTLRFRGITPVERDALSSEFTLADDGQLADLRGYTCALLALAALDSDLTREQWDQKLYESGKWSAGEVELIRDTARSAYLEANAPGIPKD